MLVLLNGCGGDAGKTAPAVNKASIEKSVREVEANMTKAIAAKDAAAFASNYAKDAVFMGTGIMAQKGPEDIRTVVAGMVADPNFKLEFDIDRVEVSSGGDMAVTRGTYQAKSTDPVNKKKVRSDHGSYVTVYRKQTDGAWKAMFDISTSEGATTAPVRPAAGKKGSASRGKKR